jgi:hypothetical protein
VRHDRSRVSSKLVRWAGSLRAGSLNLVREAKNATLVDVGHELGEQRSGYRPSRNRLTESGISGEGRATLGETGARPRETGHQECLETLTEETRHILRSAWTVATKNENWSSKLRPLQMDL